ncbi:MAG TPA: Na(+)/H(+) antiporter subunit C [Egibacteraceae bacterium]|nr:Na(+)/H(+) antiporter subunit C [Egibacteraceae bacterium]
MTIALALVAATLYAVGTYLLLQRTLTRIVIGLALIGHGANVLLLMGGGLPGVPPLTGPDGPPAGAADPLPQALALTAIVITFGIMAFLLALAYRSWTITHDDEVEDDVEDRRLATGSARTVHDEDLDPADLIEAAGRGDPEVGS